MKRKRRVKYKCNNKLKRERKVKQKCDTEEKEARGKLNNGK